MQGFERQTVTINGIDTVLLTAGRGKPLVYLHGAGTVSGFDFAAPWAERFKVVIPYHPGFGESADDPAISDIHDYVMHYLELFETLGGEPVNLVGQSMGGFIGVKLAVEHRYLIERLALVCPIGVPVPETPTLDIFSVDPKDLPAVLAADPQTVIKRLPAAPGPEFFAERQRETASAARVISQRTYDPNLPRYLHRLTMDTLLVWGKEDRLTRVEQLETWRKLLPRAEVRTYERAGHLVLDEAPQSVTDIADFFGR
jgi:pimeloyl-ACP methyl ester carboxylesterase